MISQRKAEEIARAFVTEKGEVLPGISYGISDAINFEFCFYFDFVLVPSSDKKSDVFGIAGAPGITVDKQTGKVEIITFSKLASLNKDSEKE